MAVAQTSKAAYNSLTNLGEMQSKVHEAIGELGLAHDQEILDYLKVHYPGDNWEINKVTARRNELITKEYVAAHGLKMGRAGKSVIAWCVVNPNDEKYAESIECQG
jgi:hypothetical protein